jgi:hypothetical protein
VDHITGIGDITAFFPDRYINWVKPVKGNYELSRQIADFPGTIQEVILNSEERPAKFELQLTFFDNYELTEILSFFSLHKGRWAKFWFLSQMAFFTINGDIVANDSNIRVVDNKFTKTFRGYERIYLKLKDGSLLTYKIASVEESQGEIILQTETPVNRAIMAQEVEKISFMFLMRFDVDNMTPTHITDNKGNIDTTLIEVVKEYP